MEVINDIGDNKGINKPLMTKIKACYNARGGKKAERVTNEGAKQMIEKIYENTNINDLERDKQED